MKKTVLSFALCLMVSPALAGGMKNQQQGAASGSEQMQTQAESRGQLFQVDRPEIQRIQQTLQQQGYDVGEVDGLWGPKSQQALTSWQRDNGMEPTGHLDRQTVATLGIDPNSQQAQTPDDQ